MRVLNYGSMNLDYVYQVSHFVQPGETLHVKSQQMNCGGKGLNQSIALAKAGVPVYHAGNIGTGGDILEQILKENHVNTQYISRVDELQGNAVIQVNDMGENCILLSGCSNQTIKAAQVSHVMEDFEEGDYLVIQNEINFLEEIMAHGAKKGMKIFFNPSPFEERLKRLDYHTVSWLLVNEIEAEQITGETVPEKVWGKLHEKYPSLCLLMTRGSEGSVCFTPQETLEQPIFTVKTVDTTAAGDTFTGYFIAAVLEGKTLRECLKRAAAASAIAVSRKGAAASIPEKYEVDEMLYRAN